MKLLLSAWLLCSALVVRALGPGDVIFNEIRFNAKGSGDNHFEAVELLVAVEKANLNGLQISDRNIFYEQDEEQCTLNDLGQGFLQNVPAGTLIVVYDGKGTDDIDNSDFVLRFYVKSSLFCNAAPTGKGFALHNGADNLHLIQNGKQIDFLKYSTVERRNPLSGDPGNLKWEHGATGFIDITAEDVGFRFMGDSPELNDFLVTWRTYPGSEDNNFGIPNGGRNTEWINLLRAKSTSGQSASSEKDVPVPATNP